MLTSDEDRVMSRWGMTNAVSVGVLIMLLPLMIRWFIRTKNKKITQEESSHQWKVLLFANAGNFVLSYVSSGMLNHYCEKYGEKYLGQLSDYELDNFQLIYNQQKQ